MKVDFANLNYQYELYKDEIDAAIQEVLDSSQYIMGPQIGEMEKKLADFTGAGHCISCASGTDALQLALMALEVGPGDEVITTPFTFIATGEMVAHLGAKPVFTDIDELTYNIDPGLIESAITPRTRAVMPVSLYGQPADMNEINAVASDYGLPVIEDAAQSFGAIYRGEKSCNLSHVGCTSFFPAKPLGCYGDGGAVFTSDDALAEKLRSLRVHGQTQRYRHARAGICSRMDTIQAAVLLVKLKHYPRELEKRRRVAELYSEQLGNAVITPQIRDDRDSVWAQYSIGVCGRDAVCEGMRKAGIPTSVHYPMPLHLQECFEYLGHGKGDFPVAEAVSKDIMSLPMNPFLGEDEIELVSNSLLRILG